MLHGVNVQGDNVDIISNNFNVKLQGPPCRMEAFCSVTVWTSAAIMTVTDHRAPVARGERTQKAQARRL